MSPKTKRKDFLISISILKANKEGKKKDDSELVNKARQMVAQARMKDYSDEKIKEMFREKGWSEESINRIFYHSMHF